MHTLRYILLMMTALLAVSCSSDSTLEAEKPVEPKPLVPMVFGATATSQETVVQNSPARRASSTVLAQDFKVSTWKNFDKSSQQNVMDGYKVTHKTEGTAHKWEYTNVSGQHERYWDLAAYPYEFRAVSPYMEEGIELGTNGITITPSTPFQAQKHINYQEHVSAYNGSTTVTEPCVVANVSRIQEGTEFKDFDKIKNKEINKASTTNPTREVHMPFHHLMSKIGFRIFIDNPQPTHSDYEVHIKDITISVVDAKDKFVIASNKYTATNNDQGLGKGTFDHIYASASNTTTASATYKYNGEYILLEHDEPYPYKETIDKVEKNLDFHNHLNKEDAFDLTPGELLQIPQKEVKLRVQIHIQTYHVTGGEKWVDFTFDSILHTETLNDTDITPTPGDTFTWEPEKKYIYYLRIKNLHGHEIVLHTCEVLPWDEVQTTDIDVGL